MLPGFSGRLVAEFFLERRLAESPFDDRSDPLRRALNDWRRRCQTLGPTSSVRAIFETGAEPFVNALGFAVPDQGLMIDLSRRNAVAVKQAARRVRCGAWGFLATS